MDPCCLNPSNFYRQQFAFFAWNVNLALNFIFVNKNSGGSPLFKVLHPYINMCMKNNTWILSKANFSTHILTFYQLVITIEFIKATGVHKIETTVLSCFFIIINIIGSLQKWYQTKALSLSY